MDAIEVSICNLRLALGKSAKFISAKIPKLTKKKGNRFIMLAPDDEMENNCLVSFRRKLAFLNSVYFVKLYF